MKKSLGFKCLLLMFLCVFLWACKSKQVNNNATTPADKSALFAVNNEKIYSPTFAGCFILYMMAPDRVAGWSDRLKAHETKYMPEKYHNLPLLGGWYNGDINKELLLKENVKKVFIIGDYDERADNFRKMGMDVLTIPANTAEDYIPLIRELGRQMGIPERGEELAKYGENAFAATRTMMDGLSDAQKKRVYIAHGPMGVATFCKDDMLDITGGQNVIDCGMFENSFPAVTFEQIVTFDPDVIITTNPVSGKRIIADPKWMRLRAYKEGNLYIVPYGPFGWMHDPRVTRFIGIQWLACTLHPDRCTIDIRDETKKFTKLFMHLDLTEEQVDDILHVNVYKK